MRSARSRKRSISLSEKKPNKLKQWRRSSNLAVHKSRQKPNRTISSRIRSLYNKSVSPSSRSKMKRSVAFSLFIETSIVNWTMRHACDKWKSKKWCRWRCLKWSSSRSYKILRPFRRRPTLSLKRHLVNHRKWLDRIWWRMWYLIQLLQSHHNDINATKLLISIEDSSYLLSSLVLFVIY